MEDENEKEKDVSCCRVFWAWVLQLIGWGSIVSLVIGIIEEETIFYVIFGIGYLIYLIGMFCSSTFSYLRHQHKGNSIYEKMGKLFKTAPVITFTCQCYHYETRHYTVEVNGRTENRTETIRVNTYFETMTMPYRSSKDVSGLFKLNVDKANLANKHYIKLHLRKCIDFADSISFSDYTHTRDEFYNKNRFRDTYMDFTESRDIPGFNKYELVNLREKGAPMVGPCYFALFTFLTLAQFYKSYVNKFCITQHYKIRKLVSTRYNLLEPEYDTKYAKLTPAINLIEATYTYTKEETGFFSSETGYSLPSEEELKNAQIYDNKIPHYNVQAFDSQLNSGIVEDCEGFSSEAPPPQGFNSADYSPSDGYNSAEINNNYTANKPSESLIGPEYNSESINNNQQSENYSSNPSQEYSPPSPANCNSNQPKEKEGFTSLPLQEIRTDGNTEMVEVSQVNSITEEKKEDNLLNSISEESKEEIQVNNNIEERKVDDSSQELIKNENHE